MAETKMSRRHFLKMTGGAIGLSVLAACAPPQAPAPEQPPEEAKAPEEVAVKAGAPLWVLHTKDYHPNYNDFIRKTIQDFAAEKGWELDVAFTAGFLGGGADIQKISAAVQAGDAPDMWIHTVNVYQMYQLENLVPVTDIVEQVIDKYGELAPRPKREAFIDGEFWAVPFHVRSDGGWARKDIFDEHGIDILAVETYEDLREACMEVSDPASELWGWGMTVNRSGDGGYLVTRVLHGWGATWTDETGQYVTINSPEAAEAVEWLVDTYTSAKWEKMLPPGVLSWTDPSNNEAYLGGKVAYTQNAGTVYAKAVFDNNPVAEVTVYDPPKGGPRVKKFNGLGAMNILLIKGGKNPEAAREMILHFFTDEVMEKVYETATSYAVPAYEKMWDWPVITSVPNSLAQKEAALDPSGWNVLAWPGPTTAQIGAVQTANIHTDMIAEVLNGQATAAEAVKNAYERSVEIFKEFGAPGEKG